MLKKLWLFFSQIVAVLLAIYFVLITLKPDWIIAPPPEPVDHLKPYATFADAAQSAMPAVVNVFSSKTRKRNKVNQCDQTYRYFHGKKNHRNDECPIPNLGSGVIVKSNGYILTDQHVIEGANEIEVALADGKRHLAKLVGVDLDTDLAVLKIEADQLPTISLSHLEAPKVGDVVLAIGNPFGVGQTVTMGIISALGRNHLGVTPFENFIQTDAAINPGNSGGALVDVKGNLLGINTAIYSHNGGSLGIGFATPASTALMVLESIINTGTVVRGWIGVEPQDLTLEIAESFKLSHSSGTIVVGLLKGGPADNAGIKPGDIITGVNEELINETTQLLNTIAQYKPTTEVTLHVIRKKQAMDIKIKIGKRPPPFKKNTQDDYDY